LDISRRILSPDQTEAKNLPDIGIQVTDIPTLAFYTQGGETSSIQISIISNSQLLREGLPTLLAPHVKVRLVATYSGEYHSGTELLNPPGHIVLLDSGMGRSAAIGWIRRWRELFPTTDVFILELAGDIDLIIACIEAGASGYTLQGASTAEVAEAIKDLGKGKAHASPELISRLFARVAALSASAKERSNSILTDRESEILRDMAAGYTNREIAEHLVIELRTVKQHVHHILGKLNARGRWEAVRFAAERGWIGYDLCLIFALIALGILDGNTNEVLMTICALCAV
jgi:two-component system, NarL family, response regulator NreC